MARRLAKLKWLLWRARQPGAARRLLIRLRTRPSARHAEVGSADLWAITRRFQFDFLLSRGLLPEQRLLDIGCGTLRGGIPLIDYLGEGNYTGIEARGQILRRLARSWPRSDWSASARCSSTPLSRRDCSWTPPSTTRGRSRCSST